MMLQSLGFIRNPALGKAFREWRRWSEKAREDADEAARAALAADRLSEQEQQQDPSQDDHYAYFINRVRWALRAPNERQLLCGLCAGRLLLGKVPLVKQVRRRGWGGVGARWRQCREAVPAR
jgi:hypothetical protein